MIKTELTLAEKLFLSLPLTPLLLLSACTPTVSQNLCTNQDPLYLTLTSSTGLDLLGLLLYEQRWIGNVVNSGTRIPLGDSEALAEKARQIIQRMSCDSLPDHLVNGFFVNLFKNPSFELEAGITGRNDPRQLPTVPSLFFKGSGKTVPAVLAFALSSQFRDFQNLIPEAQLAVLNEYFRTENFPYRAGDFWLGYDSSTPTDLKRVLYGRIPDTLRKLTPRISTSVTLKEDEFRDALKNLNSWFTLHPTLLATAPASAGLNQRDRASASGLESYYDPKIWDQLGKAMPDYPTATLTQIDHTLLVSYEREGSTWKVVPRVLEALYGEEPDGSGGIRVITRYRIHTAPGIDFVPMNN